MGNLLVPEGTKMIQRNQFANLELEEIELPEGLEDIRPHTFRNCKIRRLMLPSTVKKIGFGAFSGCDWLEEVVLPEGIESIGRRAFSECENLRTVHNMPQHGIGAQAFYEYRLKQHCCPYCGAPLDEKDQCSVPCDNPYEWIGSLRLYKGLFWWDGKDLITLKIHCMPEGTPAYSARFFNKEWHLCSHEVEWKKLKKAGDPRVKGIRYYNDLPRGRVEVIDGKAMVYLHPDLNTQEMIDRISNEFGLHKCMQGLQSIWFINDHTMHYRTNDEKRQGGKSVHGRSKR